MPNLKQRNLSLGMAILCTIALFASPAGHAQSGTPAAARMYADSHLLAEQLKVGDVVFIRVPHQPFLEVADTTMSWTNHVGIVADVSGTEPLIAESHLPVSGETPWSQFIARSENGRVAVTRLGFALNEKQRVALQRAVAERAGILYDTGFDLHSHRQFCSRYVREVVREATGIRLGRIETFSTLLHDNPQADLTFWQVWFFGYIPWERETVTPASLLHDNKTHEIFDGYARSAHSFKGD